MIAIWVILGLIAVVALLFALPLKIDLQYLPEQGLQYCIKYLFFSLADSRKPEKSGAGGKPETPKKSKDSKGKLLSFLGLEEISSAARAKQTIRDKGIVGTISSVYSVVKSLFSRIFGLLRKGIFTQFDLEISVGGEDAAETAMTYGQVCAGVYPLLSLLDSCMKFRKRKVDILCNYDSNRTTVAFRGRLHYRLGSLLFFALGFLLRYIKQSSKEGKSL